MTKRVLLISGLILLIAALVLSGCTQYVPPDQRPIDSGNISSKAVEKNETKDAGTETPAKDTTGTAEKETGTAQKTTASESVVVTPVPEKPIYEESEPEPSSVEKDTCGCSFRWDPVCGKDGKTYLNQCLFRCFGNDVSEIENNGQCKKKQGALIYADDFEMEYESKKWNGGYCWRQMYQDSGIRYCKSLLVNGRIDDEPKPARGNWLDEKHLVLDKAGRKDSHTIKLATGEQATNEEFNMLFQPLFEDGRYRFSFWARQDIAANNDWIVSFTVRDWWEEKPRPVGVLGCYRVTTDIRADEHYIHNRPNDWKHYHYEFDAPLNLSQWQVHKRRSAECEYSWDQIPHGYRIEVTGPTVGEAWFDDFSLIKTK
jgi:hypothetical protein